MMMMAMITAITEGEGEEGRGEVRRGEEEEKRRGEERRGGGEEGGGEEEGGENKEEKEAVVEMGRMLMMTEVDDYN